MRRLQARKYSILAHRRGLMLVACLISHRESRVLERSAQTPASTSDKAGSHFSGGDCACSASYAGTCHGWVRPRTSRAAHAIIKAPSGRGSVPDKPVCCLVLHVFSVLGTAQYHYITAVNRSIDVHSFIALIIAASVLWVYGFVVVALEVQPLPIHIMPLSWPCH